MHQVSSLDMDPHNIYVETVDACCFRLIIWQAFDSLIILCCCHCYHALFELFYCQNKRRTGSMQAPSAADKVQFPLYALWSTCAIAMIELTYIDTSCLKQFGSRHHTASPCGLSTQEAEAEIQKAKRESESRLAATRKQLLAAEDDEKAELEREYKCALALTCNCKYAASFRF